MEYFWQYVIGGCTVAALSGVTIIAYKHPSGYGRLYWVLVAAIYFVSWTWFSYTIAYGFGFSDALSQLNALNPNLGYKYPTSPSPPLWAFVIPFGIVLYLGFLGLLPFILRHDKEKKQSNDRSADNSPEQGP
jgi:hypothetical protein